MPDLAAATTELGFFKTDVENQTHTYTPPAWLHVSVHGYPGACYACALYQDGAQWKVNRQLALGVSNGHETSGWEDVSYDNTNWHVQL